MLRGKGKERMGIENSIAHENGGHALRFNSASSPVMKSSSLSDRAIKTERETVSTAEACELTIIEIFRIAIPLSEMCLHYLNLRLRP